MHIFLHSCIDTHMRQCIITTTPSNTPPARPKRRTLFSSTSGSPAGLRSQNLLRDPAQRAWVHGGLPRIGAEGPRSGVSVKADCRDSRSPEKVIAQPVVARNAGQEHRNKSPLRNTPRETPVTERGGKHRIELARRASAEGAPDLMHPAPSLGRLLCSVHVVRTCDPQRIELIDAAGRKSEPNHREPITCNQQRERASPGMSPG